MDGSSRSLRVIRAPLTVAVALAVTFCAHAKPQAKLPRADAERLQRRIDALSKFGANADGGIDRVAYSEADRQARAWVMTQMRSIGLKDVRIDAAGNILGRRPGTARGAKPIMFGSHIDSVLGGGNYDGQAGVVTALEAIELLNAAGRSTRSPLDVVVFSNEEGGLIGSLAMTGHLKPSTLDVKSDSGLTIRQGIRAIGGDPDALETAVLPKGALKAFVELHIEQGAILHEEKIDIGIVEGIVGIEWWDVIITGVANHAGTTPMDRRQDALVAAAELVLAVQEIGRWTEGRQVATVGRIKALPGAPNVIPGRVEMSLEIRDLSKPKIDQTYARIQARARRLARKHGVEIAFRWIDVASAPALTDPAVRTAIAEQAKGLGLSTKMMPSGAGHDAQDMARIAPTGMIFVPSIGGISHSPKERTAIRDLANGADVLVRTIVALDRR